MLPLKGVWAAPRNRRCPASTSALSLLEGSLDIPLIFATADILTFVMELFPPHQGQIHLNPAPLQVHLERNEGQPLLLYLADQLADLLAMQQQFASSAGIVVKKLTRGLMGRDMDVEQQDFTIADQGKSVSQIHLALSNGLHLRSHELNPGLKGLENLVEKPGLAVVANNFEAFVLVTHSFILEEDGSQQQRLS